MRDTKLRVLESHKTTSRKAIQREQFSSRNLHIHSAVSSAAPSAAPSAANSAAPSRNVSRAPSPTEEDLHSLTLRQFEEAEDDNNYNSSSSTLVSAAEIDTVIESLVDRKRSSVQGREQMLIAFNRIVRNDFLAEPLEERFEELLGTLVKSVKSEVSDKEAVLALNAIALIAVTTGLPTVYDGTASTLQRSIRISSSYDVKAAAIHALGAVTFFAGGGEESVQEQLPFLMEIIESDGRFANASDDVQTVKAAVEEWGFLATGVEDIESESRKAVEAFLEQLDSEDVQIQIACGECIALLYEKSYTPLEEDEEVPSGVEEADRGADEILVKRYDAYPDTSKVLRKVEELANASGRHIHRNMRRQLHQNFTTIQHTIEKPQHGPYYSTAIAHETGEVYGNRKTIKISGKKDEYDAEVALDRWWKWIRLSALKRTLLGGLVTHFMQGNEVLEDCLPLARFDKNSYKKSRATEKQRDIARKRRMG
ncbi:hypothetical protein KEM54_002020 [Ascosphaera aggregata]|nr:hypothetical protein KEM54_002020 [Ascosphaera aggregata]